MVAITAATMSYRVIAKLRHRKLSAIGAGHRRALAPTFRADVMLLFIPSRGAAARRQAHGRSADRPARAACRPTSPISF